MKYILVTLFLLISSLLVGQRLHKDTIEIPEVAISAEQSFIGSSEQQLDSSSLNNPVNHHLGEVLASRANLFMKSYGMGSMATIAMRGSGASHSNIYWNGIQLNSASNGVVDLSLYPKLFLDEVQVDYGNASLRSGSGGLGGAVQLNNLVEFKKRRELSISQDFGSFNYRNSSLKYSFGNSKWQSVSRILYRTADNNFNYQDIGEAGFPTKEVKNASLLQNSFMQSVHFRPKENQQLEAHLWVYNSDRNLPPLMTISDFRENQKDQSIRGVIGYKYYGEKYQFSIKSSMIKDEITYTNSRLTQASKSQNTSFRNVVEAEKKWNKTSLYSRLNLDFEEAAQLALGSDKVQRKRISAFAEVNQQWSQKFSTLLAVRKEIIVQEAQYLLPKLELKYQLHKALLLFSKISENIKYPTLNDLYWQAGGNPSLKAEQNRSAEVGFRFHKLLAQKSLDMLISSTVYYSSIDNYIQWQPTALGFWQAVNLRKVEIKGIETRLELKQQKGKLKKSLLASYTYTQSLNKTKLNKEDGAFNQQLIYLPEHQTTISARLKYKSYFFNYQWQFVGARYLSSDNSDWLPSYQLSNISAGRSICFKKHQLDVQFSVLNLFDLEYQAIQWRPMPNRNYQLSLTYHLL